LSISSAGTGPMHAFTNILNAPAIAIGSTYVFSRIHSPNEFTRIDLLKKATKCMCLILDNFARSS
jgi:acetylornithine deacetylase/succinyl-diaminopimelate desuccinylase-like protein